MRLDKICRRLSALIETFVANNDWYVFKKKFYFPVKFQNWVAHKDGVKCLYPFPSFVCLTHHPILLSSKAMKNRVQIWCGRILNVRPPSPCSRLSVLFSQLFFVFFWSPIKVDSTVGEALVQSCTKCEWTMSMYEKRISEDCKWGRENIRTFIVHSNNFSVYIYTHTPNFSFAPFMRVQRCGETLLNDASEIEKRSSMFPKAAYRLRSSYCAHLCLSHISLPRLQNLYLQTTSAPLDLLISLCSEKLFKSTNFDPSYNTSILFVS